MKLSKQELAVLKQRMEHIVANSTNPLQIKLAQHWLDKIKQRGRYILKGAC